jgi:flagellar protein FliS
MNKPRHASHEYLRNAVHTARPEQLQLMLLDGAIRFATRGKEALAAKRFEDAYNAFERAQKIVCELQAGMRREVQPELVDQMGALYTFIYARIVEASFQRDPALVDEALRILQHQRETWALLIDKIARETAGAASASGTGRASSSNARFDTSAASGSALSLQG